MCKTNISKLQYFKWPSNGAQLLSAAFFIRIINVMTFFFITRIPYGKDKVVNLIYLSITQYV